MPPALMASIHCERSATTKPHVIAIAVLFDVPYGVFVIRGSPEAIYGGLCPS